MTPLKTILLITCLSIFLTPIGIHAQQERILSFDSHIDIRADGDVVVTETIRVVAAGNKIRRGIYRDFPTRYRNSRGVQVTVRFEVLEVLRDNRPDAYHIERQSNGMRVYIGNKDVFLKPGEYTYTFVYRTDRQIGFFERYDELYWNVTGNGWDFVIDKARAVVQLPPGAEVLQYAAYTGPAGAGGKDYAIDETAGDIGFATTRALAPREGLTIAVAWPKGVVNQPDTVEKVGYLLGDNRGLVVALCGLIALLGYYASAWWKAGRDPIGGAIIPRYEPPKGISPAGLRFVQKMGFDKKALAVAVVSMAVKGFLTIGEDSHGDYSLEVTGSHSSSLSPGEVSRVARHLFPRGKTVDHLEKDIAQTGGGCRESPALPASAVNTKRRTFCATPGYFIPGIAISVLTLGGIVLTASLAVLAALFMMVWLSGWSAGVYVLGTMVIAAWRSRKVAGAMAISLFALPFFGGEIIGFGLLASAIGLPSLVLFGPCGHQHRFLSPAQGADPGRQTIDGRHRGLEALQAVWLKETVNLLDPPAPGPPNTSRPCYPTPWPWESDPTGTSSLPMFWPKRLLNPHPAAITHRPGTAAARLSTDWPPA